MKGKVTITYPKVSRDESSIVDKIVDMSLGDWQKTNEILDRVNTIESMLRQLGAKPIKESIWQRVKKTLTKKIL